MNSCNLSRWACYLALGLLTVLRAGAAASAPYRPQHGTQILWDTYGVAHVDARSVPDLFYGFGWAQAHSHGNLIARLYAEARGRAAEYYGEAELANDRWMAINDVPARSQRWLAQQTPEFRRNLVAFAAGLSAYEASHASEFSVEARRVYPLSALDVIAHAQRLFQFVYAAPASTLDHLPAESALVREPAGSNAWAIAPRRSADGHALLLMNPHLSWAPGWSTYYEVQLRAPGIDLYGATQVGLPVLRFVFSDYLSFTHTVNAPNAVTFYRITPDGDGYRFDGRRLPYQQHAHRLEVRQADGSLRTEALAVRSTVHGPLVAQREGIPLAMRVAGLEHPFALEQYWQMATAHDFHQFQNALRRLQVPTFNIVYADRDGHIEYLYNGLVPRHPFGDLHYWSSIVPGDSSRTLWQDYLSYDELPKVIDPEGGTVQNSNNPPWDTAWPSLIDPAPYVASIRSDSVNLRMARGVRMLSETEQFSLAQLSQDKWSHRSELADRVLPDLLEATARYGDALARQAASVLVQWDRCTNADSRGALLFLDWVDQPGGLSGNAADGFARPLDLMRPLTTPGGLADPQRAVQALEAAARHTLASYGALDTPWGAVMRLHLGDVDLPASGGPGRLGVFDVIDYAALQAGTRAANFGASFTALVSFAVPVHAKVLLSYGSSSQAHSGHQSDQLGLLSHQQLRDAWRSPEQVQAHLESRDVF